MSSAPNTANAITVCTAVAYLTLYSGYDKATKSFDIARKLTKIFSFSNVGVSLTELNKALALTAMSVSNAAVGAHLLVAIAPTASTASLASGLAGPLTTRAVAMSLVHGAFSSYKYAARFTGPKAIAMFLGPLSAAALVIFGASGGRSSTRFGGSQLCEALDAGVSRQVPLSVTGAAAVTTCIITSHVYLMERSTETGKLVMRPFAVGGLIASAVLSAAAFAVLGLRRGH